MKAANLTKGIFVDADFSPLKNEDGVLQYADLEDANFKKADFSNANLEGVDFDGSQLQGAIWTGARNLNPLQSMSMGISKSGKSCEHALFKLPERKPKSGTPSKTCCKHVSVVFKSMVGGGDSDEDDGSDSGGSSDGDSDGDDSGEESEEEEEEEKKGLKYVVDQLDVIVEEVKKNFTDSEEIKKLKETALAVKKVKEEALKIKQQALT